MSADSIVLQLGSKSFTLAEVVIGAAACGLGMLVLVLWLIWRAGQQQKLETMAALRRSSDLEYRLAEVAGSLRSFADQAQGAHAHLTRTLEERLSHVGQRVGAGLNEQAERTNHSLTQLYERLAIIDMAQKNMTSLSSEMISLKDILSNKQTRGAYGQGRMEAIIRDGLPARSYAFQPTLSNGTRPDCLVHLPDSQLSLVIDAKFPLEAFNALRAAKHEGDMRASEARLRADVARHVKDIAGKYLITGETHETAIMFVPSESVYADLHEKFEDIIQKAHKSRVIIASPNVLMLLVQTMQAIFKDSAMREQAHVIRNEVVHLLEDVGRLRERVTDLQKHFGSANTDLEKLSLSADKIVKRGLRIESLDLEEPHQIGGQPLPNLAGGRGAA